MLNPLFGNKSLEKILFFLLLNGKCYAAQLSQRFASPLTPLQHALGKLERTGVLISYNEGKTRFFEFNPSYVLLSELESLLKKAYVHLPAEKKQLYYSPAFQAKPQKERKNFSPKSNSGQATLKMVWNKLQNVKTLCFSAKSKSLGMSSGWNGLGKGNIDLKRVEENVLIFQEKGSWVSEENKNFEFSNAFRWTFQADSGAILLEHLRFGVQNPVYLFALVPIDSNTLESIDSHVCKEDSYFGQLRCDKHFVQFNWRVIGPKKNEEIDYLYT